MRISWLLASWGAGLGVWLAIDPAALPIEALLPLQEGTTDTSVSLARGEGGHAGWVFDRFYLAVVMNPRRILDGLVRFDLSLAAASAIGLAGLLRGLGASWTVSLALVVGSAWSLPVQWAARSEGPGPILWVLCLITTASWLTVRHASTAWKLSGWITLAVGAVLMAGLRTELAVLPLLGFLTSSAVSWHLPVLPLPRPSRMAAGVVVLLVGTLAAPGFLLPPSTLGDSSSWVAAALHPLDPSWLVLPWVLAGVMPLGLALAVLAGVVSGLRHPLRGLGLAVAWLFLLRLYHAAAHGNFLSRPGDLSVFEIVRYLSFLAVPTALLAWQGIAVSPERARRWLLLAMVLPPVPALLSLVPRTTTWRTGVDFSAVHAVDRDLQTEARFLVRLLREHGECGFAVRAVPGGDGVGWAVFAGPEVPTAHGIGPGTRRLGPAAGPAERAASLGRPMPCWVTVHGHGCALAGGCPAPRGDLVREQAVLGPAYAHPAHSWDAGEHTLRAWRSNAP